MRDAVPVVRACAQDDPIGHVRNSFGKLGLLCIPTTTAGCPPC